MRLLNIEHVQCKRDVQFEQYIPNGSWNDTYMTYHDCLT